MFRHLILLFLFPFSLLAQTTELFSLHDDFSVIGTDIKGHSYLLRNNTLYKYDPSGFQQYNYSNHTLGTMSNVNVSNPLKITVLYADRGTLIVLDNTLSPVGSPIDLHQSGFDDPLIACPSDENGVWIYDASSGMFTLMNWNGIRIRQSVDVRRLFSKTFLPEDMTLISGHIIAFAPKSGVIVFDNAGNVVKTFDPSPEMKGIGQNGIYFSDGRNIQILDPLTLAESSLQFPKDEISNFTLNFPYLLVRSERKISLFLLTALR